MFPSPRAAIPGLWALSAEPQHPEDFHLAAALSFDTEDIAQLKTSTPTHTTVH